MFVLGGRSSLCSFSDLLDRYYLRRNPRPLCLVPVTDSLRNQRRPTWLGLILLFFNPSMLAVWKRLATGIIVGLVCDSLTGNLDYTWLDRF